MSAACRVGRYSVLLVALLAAPISIAQAQAVPVELRAAIMLRALRYERGFGGQGGTAKLLLVSGSSRSSRDDASDMRRTFAQLAGSGAAGRSLSFSTLTTSDGSEALTTARSRGADVVYIARGAGDLDGRLRGVPSGTIVLCGDVSDMSDAGCAVGVEVSGRTARIVIHLRNANRAGLSFDARLLQLARVIR